MDTQQIKNKLEQEKARLEAELNQFADKKKTPKADWKARFPDVGTDEEDSVFEVAEYEERLSAEGWLEEKVQAINSALAKIESGDYGKCEKCGEEIDEKRLEAAPEARFCQKCAA